MTPECFKTAWGMFLEEEAELHPASGLHHRGNVNVADFI